MKIHIKATGKFSPKTQRPTFQYWIDDKYVGECYEAIINCGEIMEKKLQDSYDEGYDLSYRAAIYNMEDY